MIYSASLPCGAALILVATSITCLADDPVSTLPGVDTGGYSVVVPAAEPEAEVAEISPYGEGFVRVPGTDTYVKISGLVRFDVGFSTENRKLPD